MMHQPVKTFLVYSSRPERDTIIEKDEIISLKIDLEVLSIKELFEKHFETDG